MKTSRVPKPWLARLSAIIFLIPGFLHIPLPEIDFHNIRHLHGAGQVCVYHDHLLRWHPSAGLDNDVRTVHWHWFAPQSDSSALPTHEGGESPDHSSHLALHAHRPDCAEPVWTGSPALIPDLRRTTQERADEGTDGNPALAPAPLNSWLPPSIARGPAPSPIIPPPAVPLTDLTQRWNC